MTPGLEPLVTSAEARLALVREIYRGESGTESLQARDGKQVLRVPLDPQGSVIIKLWSRPGAATGLRRLTGTSVIQREARMLLRLRAAGLDVPKLYGVWPLAGDGVPYTDVMIVEDLGPGQTGTEHIKSLIEAGRWRDLLEFEGVLIDTTLAILDAGVVDSDHSVVNFYAARSGRMTRVDFELARRMFSRRLSRPLLVEMMGRLLSSYAFAVQPDVGRVADFARRLRERVGLAPAVWTGAAHYVRHKMDQQREAHGIDTRIALPW